MTGMRAGMGTERLQDPSFEGTNRFLLPKISQSFGLDSFDRATAAQAGVVVWPDAAAGRRRTLVRLADCGENGTSSGPVF
jgi:hypothetical protein